MDNYLKKEFYELVKDYESVFDFIQDAAPDGIWYWNLENSEEVWFNNRFCKTMGYVPGSLSMDMKTLYGHMHAEDIQKLSDWIASNSETTEAVSGEPLRFRHKSGNQVLMSCRVKSVSDHTGKKKRLLIAFQQIKKKEHAKRVLKVYNKWLGHLLNGTSDILVELTADGTQKYISPVVTRYTGYEPYELKRPFSEVIHPDDVDRIQARWKQVLAEPERIHRDTYRHIHKTKGYVWMEATLQSFLNYAGIGSVICSVREISEQKQAEEFNQQSKRQYKTLSGAATDMLALNKLKDIYSYITRTLNEQYPQTVCLFATVDQENASVKFTHAEGMDNACRDNIIDKGTCNIIGKDFNLPESIHMHYKSGRLTKFDGGLARFAGYAFTPSEARKIEKLLQINNIYYIGISKDEKLYAVLMMFTLNNTELFNPSYIESFARQAGIIIERKLMEQKLRESENQLNEAIVTKDKFLSIIAHDLKNPFNLLLGFSEMNLEYINQGNFERLPEIARYMRDSALDGYELLNNLLDWSGAQNGNIKFRPGYQNLLERVRKATSMLTGIALQKKIAIEKDFPADLSFYADGDMFDTILRNLVSNALKYTPKGGVIHISGENTEDGVIVKVRDNGVGISPENTEKLFSMKENVTTKGTNGETGTGLGLLLCKEFVERHNGEIGIESESGEGTTIWFTLPNNQASPKKTLDEKEIEWVKKSLFR